MAFSKVRKYYKQYNRLNQPFMCLKKYILESKLSSQLIENITAIVEKIAKKCNTEYVNKLINSLLPLMFKAKV